MSAIVKEKEQDEGSKHASITSEEILETDKFKWITLKMIKYKDDEGVERDWESAMRTTRKGEVDAVFIVAHVKMKDREPHILLVSQFRPPCSSYVLEFPAGLVDEGESSETAALRELREETGYFGEVRNVSPALFIDPGMSNANLQFVNVLVDCEKELNKDPQKKLDDEENIDTILIPKSKFLYYMNHPNEIKGMENKNVTVSGLLYAFALGIPMFSD